MLGEFNYFILTKVSHSSFYHFFAVINIYTFRRTLRQLPALQHQRQYAEVNRQQHDRVIRACFIVVDASRLYKIVNLFT